MSPAHRQRPRACGAARPKRGAGACARGLTSAGGFTLLELLIVITIIGLLAALTVPSLKNVQKSNALASASQQLIDDVAYARRLAIKDRTTVLMVFLPAAKAAEAGLYGALNTGEKKVLLRGQQTAYALYSFREVGDQPGDAHPRYLRTWRYLPDGYFIPSWKFLDRVDANKITIDASESHERKASLIVWPFARSGSLVPVPSLITPRRVNVTLPYLAFGPTGGLLIQDTVTGEFTPSQDDEYIPLGRGSFFLARDPSDEKQLTWESAEIDERPPGNSTREYHLIAIDKLTGRTRVVKPEIAP